MFAEFTCGKCEAHMQMDAEDNDDSVWSLVWRFANNHTTETCGGMFTGGSSPDNIEPRIKFVPRFTKDDDGEEASV